MRNDDELTFSQYIDIKILIEKYNGIVKKSDWVKRGKPIPLPKYSVYEKNNNIFSSTDDNLIKNSNIEKFFKANRQARYRIIFNKTEDFYKNLSNKKWKINEMMIIKYFDYLLLVKGFDYSIKFAQLTQQNLIRIVNNRKYDLDYSHQFSKMLDGYSLKDKILNYNTEHIDIKLLELNILENEDEILKEYYESELYITSKEKKEYFLKNEKNKDKNNLVDEITFF